MRIDVVERSVVCSMNMVAVLRFVILSYSAPSLPSTLAAPSHIGLAIAAVVNHARLSVTTRHFDRCHELGYVAVESYHRQHTHHMISYF